ncbi:helix-turn-helix transcriptional regulator [Novosphingobium aquiterrae]|uniref:Helix-turn-helix transcriptional regulator n=1 Tax=Novosphingobium aquiterrae TaxID=624388 RepID=A0ABV6PJJ7_9SPHN
MSMMESLSTSRAALTPKELEVLRLLAAGHTVKSIAVQLDRSEASINERLRDARRKTGVGSSRELARMLSEQKIWDRNFDLSLPHSPPERTATPSDTKRLRSKGTLFMFLALPLAAIGMVVAATDSAPQIAQSQAAVAAAEAHSPLVGKWSLDVMRIPTEERPRSVTIAFTQVGGKWNTQVEIVAPDGSVQRAESTAAPDGVLVPVSGNMGFIDTGSVRQPAPNTLVMTLAKNGAPVSTRVYTVAKDGKTMTETIIWASGGIPKLETTYFNRIS